jgi:hypothetical protein
METATALDHLYKPGDEVVVELHGVDAYNLERGAPVHSACLPAWTIGIVLGQRIVECVPVYVLRIEHDGCACVCTADASAIDGLA